MHTLVQVLASIAAFVGYVGIYIAHTSNDRRLHGDEEHEGHEDNEHAAHNASHELSHAHDHKHMLALTHWHEVAQKSAERQLHIIFGYVALLLATAQFLSGMAKVYSKIPRLKWHGKVGRVVSLLGAVNAGLGLLAMKWLALGNVVLILLFIGVALLSHGMRWEKEEERASSGPE